MNQSKEIIMKILRELQFYLIYATPQQNKAILSNVLNVVTTYLQRNEIDHESLRMLQNFIDIEKIIPPRAISYNVNYGT